jgi:chromosome segregation ATPase
MTDEARLQADIEALRPKFPDTQDLYREVSMILFFRYGITPTANKLYQLVRKGSMSAPAEALARFWDNLREKSRVRIEHPDIPQALQEAAGELTAKLWQQARAQADEACAAIRLEAAQQIEAASLAVEKAEQRETVLRQDVAAAQAQTAALSDQIRVLEQRLAHDEGLRQGLVQQIEQITAQRQELVDHVEAARAAERHAVDGHRRLLVEVDRERVLAGRLQKELDALKAATAQAATVHAEKLAQASHQLEELRQRNAGLEVSIATLRSDREHLQRAAAHGDDDRRSSMRLRSAGTTKGPMRRRVR